jgi:hypothetical protein
MSFADKREHDHEEATKPREGCSDKALSEARLPVLELELVAALGHADGHDENIGPEDLRFLSVERRRPVGAVALVDDHPTRLAEIALGVDFIS